jgi:hypothetical protein
MHTCVESGDDRFNNSHEFFSGGTQGKAIWKKNHSGSGPPQSYDNYIAQAFPVCQLLVIKQSPAVSNVGHKVEDYICTTYAQSENHNHKNNMSR